MIKLIEVTVNKYKSIQLPQTVRIENDITTFVGMNEAGKTVFLEAIAKMNYFDGNDKDFKFNIIHDYPRKELVKFQKDNSPEQEAIKCCYRISEKLKHEMESELGEGTISFEEFTRAYKYKEDKYSVGNVQTNIKKYWDFLISKYQVNKDEDKQKIIVCKTLEEVTKIESTDEKILSLKKDVETLINNSNDWSDKLSGYVWKKWLNTNLPKFWYYDDYYLLDGDINLNHLQSGTLDAEETKTTNALLEIADIKTSDILQATNYEKFKAQLEAASNEITEQVFKYWKSNKELDIEFDIETKPQINNPANIEKYLHVRIKNKKNKVTLSLHRRSKGFQWFVSFVVWFTKIQADKNSNYILLFDEPGLNLHALAQTDLLKFIEDLSKDYQIIYTTHSPFMIDSDRLDRVRTIYESDNSSIISESIQEKDPNTLFPLQAALGYNIAQNLFISKNNLLVEGPADLLYLTIMSNLLESQQREGLKDKITIVPIGGLDKVATFISLLRGSKLNIVCLLDTFIDSSGKQKLEDLIFHKIIKENHIRFFDEFSGNGSNQADVEDMFEKEEYLKLFNNAFKEKYKELTLSNLNDKIKPIIVQINQALNIDRFNHYTPANKLSQMSVKADFFKKGTLDRFENMFKEINKLFEGKWGQQPTSQK